MSAGGWMMVLTLIVMVATEAVNRLDAAGIADPHRHGSDA